MSAWPMLLDIPRDDCSRILRRMELQTYGSCISVLRAQGPLTKDKRLAIENLRQIFHIKTDRHKAEVRRAVNDELLTTIAERLYGSDTELDWAVEGRRLVPLVRRLEPITAYTPIANEVAEMTHIVNASLPPPRDPSRSPTPETDDAEETMEEMEMAPPPPPPPPCLPTIIAPVKLPVQTMHHHTPIMAAMPPQLPPMIKVEKAASRKRRVSSFESTTQNIPPPSKIPYIPPASTPSRTVSIPVGMSGTTTRMPTIPTSIRPNTTSTSSTPKVLIVSSSSSNTTPSLLQRSLSVPMVKTVKSIGTGLMSSSVAPGSSFQSSFATTLGVPLMGSPKIRPKTVAPPTVLPKGRSGSIVIPLAPNIPGSGVQLRAPTVVQTKPTLQPVQVKQDASGVKVISGSHKITPKPPTVTVTAGSNRVVSIASAPRISPMICSTQPTITSATITTQAASTAAALSSTSKPVTLSLPTSSNMASKQNVILVKKGGAGGYTPVQNQGNISLSGSGRVLIQGTPHGSGTKGVSGDSSLAQHLQLPPGSRQGNVIVLDLSHEHINKNSTLTELLQASGFVTMKPSTSKGDGSEEFHGSPETLTSGGESKAVIKESSSKTVISPTSSKLKTKILRAVPTRAKTQEPSEYSIKLVSGRASVESSLSPVVQAKVVREIASKPPEPRVIKFDEVAKEVIPKKILPMKEPTKIEVKLQPNIVKPSMEPKKMVEILPESENIMVNLIDQVVESSVSIATTPASTSYELKTAEKPSPQEESLHEFLTFKKNDDVASKKVLAMLQEEPTESVEVTTSVSILDSSSEIEESQREDKME